MGGMNLESMIGSQINSVVAKIPVNIHVYNGQARSYGGVVDSSYTILPSIKAQIQLTNLGVPRVRQLIENAGYISTTSVIRDFRIQSYDLTGLNRNLSTGGDYIELNGLFHRIIAVPENFITGWVWVIAVEGGTTIEST